MIERLSPPLSLSLFSLSPLSLSLSLSLSHTHTHTHTHTQFLFGTGNVDQNKSILSLYFPRAAFHHFFFVVWLLLLLLQQVLMLLLYCCCEEYLMIFNFLGRDVKKLDPDYATKLPQTCTNDVCSTHLWQVTIFQKKIPRNAPISPTAIVT